MAGTDDLIKIMALECDVAKHLFTKLPRDDWEATLEWRPSAGQRSTLELLRYLSYCGIGSCLTCVEGSWEGWQRVAQRGEVMEAEDFPDAMDLQQQEITELLGFVPATDLATRRATNPLGQELTLGLALLDMPVRWLTAYRMQLYLYIREMGAEVGTPDCWYGLSLQPPS